MGSRRQVLDSDQTVEVRHEPIRVILFFIGSMAFVAAGIWILTLDPSDLASSASPRYRWALPWLPWVSIPLFGAIALTLVRNLFDRRPQIVIGPNGFYWRKWSKVEIPWSEISKIELKSKGIAKYITMNLRDRARYPADGIIARFIWINGIRGYGDIALPMMGFDRSAKDILDVMERFSKAST
jgi:hypothetical protein